LRYGRCLKYERVLELRVGCLMVSVEWESPAGTAVRVTSTRLVSFVHRSVAAILYDVEPVESKLRVAVQSELIANEPVPSGTKDPRVAAVLESPLESEWFGDHDTRVVLVHSTRQSKLRMAAAMDHLVEGPDHT